MSHFPLARQAARVALLLGILDQTVTNTEIRIWAEQDIQKRPRTKPVVAGGRRYGSVKAAAEGLKNRNHWLYQEISCRYAPGYEAQMMLALARAISYRASCDNVQGFFWC